MAVDPHDFVRRDVYEAERRELTEDVKNTLQAVQRIGENVSQLATELHRYQLENRDREGNMERGFSRRRTQTDDRSLQWLVMALLAIVAILGPHLNFH